MGREQVTKENIPYETTDRKFENCRKLRTVLFKNKKLLQQKHRRRLGRKEVEQDPFAQAKTQERYQGPDTL